MQAARRIGDLVPTSTQAWGISRCDGTYEELVAYRSGSNEPGWHVVVSPRVGDLLVGTVGLGAARIIVNVNRVEGLSSGHVMWAEATDVPVIPSLGWSAVAARAGRFSRPWGRLDGDDAAEFVRALVAEMQSRVDTPESEGTRRISQCRDRSKKNRLRKLDHAKGTCEGCGQNYRVGFGTRGDRALEVHHLKPLGQSPGAVRTSLSDLAVLCATCHRLLHADLDLRLEAVQVGWARIRAETQ